MTESYFTLERAADGTEWIVPTDLARGPWDYDACHGGPPTAMLVRALERAVPSQRLARISVELGRPIPMAGFRIETTVVRAGRASAQTRAVLVDGAGKERVSAVGMHVAPVEHPLFEGSLDNSGVALPALADTAPGDFPMRRLTQRWVGFRSSVEVRYPPARPGRRSVDRVHAHGAAAGRRGAVTVPARRSPGGLRNAFSRHTDPEVVQFINTDLVIALHRDPVGEWLGSRSASQWQPGGVGLADALLFDGSGPVGRALQTLLLRPAPDGR